MLTRNLTRLSLMSMLVACVNETPIGEVFPDLHGGLDGSLSSPDTSTSDTLDNGPFPDKPQYALRNGDGSYSCNPNFIDPCPSLDPVHGDECKLTHGTTCDIKSGDIGQCTCMASKNKHVWQCHSGGSRRSDCPSQIPPTGASCQNLQGVTCEYAKPLACTCEQDLISFENRFVACSCDPQSKTWDCRSGAPNLITPYVPETCATPEPVFPEGPALDGSKKVLEMSDAEIETWCLWSRDLELKVYGAPNPEPAFRENGYGWGWPTTFCGSAPSYCYSPLPLKDCQRLIKRKRCGVRVQDLTQCFLTALGGCQPILGEGCAPLVSDPECTETIIQPYRSPTESPFSQMPQQECYVPFD